MVNLVHVLSLVQIDPCQVPDKKPLKCILKSVFKHTSSIKIRYPHLSHMIGKSDFCTSENKDTVTEQLISTFGFAMEIVTILHLF